MDKTFDGTKKFPIIAIIRPIILFFIYNFFVNEKSTEASIFLTFLRVLELLRG